MTRHALSLLVLAASVLAASPVFAASDAWYVEGGNFAPATRIPFTIENPLDSDRANCPVVITREEMPVKNLHEMWVTVVDPALEPRPEPPPELLRRQGGHLLRAERNGRMLHYQLDDIDKDGVWDELFFQTDLKAGEKRDMYIYIGFTQRGWMEHGTHAAIGSYCRHLVPFWESAHVGWKLWYPTSCDVFGKRTPGLMSNELYMKNLNGYGVPYEYGSDIMRVAWSFGGGGAALFEYPARPDSVSIPRFAFTGAEKLSPGNWNEGQLEDTRYAFDVVVNGPVRSMIRVKTMNWKTPAGSYEMEQLYTVYTLKNYSTCRVSFPTFLPLENGVAYCCGIRRNAAEFDSYHTDALAITMGTDELSDPDDPDGTRTLKVDFVGNAIAVKDEYAPAFQFVPGFEGNYCFRVPVNDGRSFEYMIFAAWSEGQFLTTPAEFREYVLKSVREFNNPVKVRFSGVERKGE